MRVRHDRALSHHFYSFNSSLSIICTPLFVSRIWLFNFIFFVILRSTCSCFHPSTIRNNLMRALIVGGHNQDPTSDDLDPRLPWLVSALRGLQVRLLSYTRLFQFFVYGMIRLFYSWYIFITSTYSTAASYGVCLIICTPLLVFRVRYDAAIFYFHSFPILRL